MRDSSYNIVVDRLQKFAEGHFYIKSFAHDTLDALDTTKSIEYPIMQVIPGTMTPSQGQVAYSFDIVFADLARRKTDLELNTREIISDMTRIALDLLVEIKNGQVLFGSDVQVEQGSVITSFIDGYENTITGVTLAITIIVQDTWNACIIPADWSTGGTGYPSEGMRVMSIPVLDEGNFIVNAYEIDFRGSGVTVTRTGNTAIVTITGGGGGGGITCEDLPTCEVIVEINDAIDTLTSSLGALGATVSSLSATVGGIQNDITAIESEQVTQNNNITALQNDLTALSNSLATVATTGDYNDLINLPDLEGLPYIPLAGTNTGEPVTGDVEVSDNVSFLFDNGDYVFRMMFNPTDPAIGMRITYNDLINAVSNSWTFPLDSESVENGVIYRDTLKKRFWTKAGAPTASDDANEGYIVGSLLYDTTTGLLYRCTSATAGAAVWTNNFNQFRTAAYINLGGGTIPAGATQFAPIGSQAAFNADESTRFTPQPYPVVAHVFKVRTRTAQPATGSLVVSLRANSLDVSTITIPAGSAAGTYTSTTVVSINENDLLTIGVTNNASSVSAQLTSSTIGLYNI